GGKEPSMMPYGDGVPTVNPADLPRSHKRHGKLAPVTAVHPPARFGELVVSDDPSNPRVLNFAEKPQVRQGWINGGFFVLEPKVLDYIDNEDTSWQGEPMERLAEEGQLMAYRHDGFWPCLDTIRDGEDLQGLGSRGEAPWKAWQ